MSSKSRSTGVLLMLLVTAVAVTIAAAFLLISDRGNIFALSLCGIVLAELLFGGFSIKQSMTDEQNRSALPHHAGILYILGLYLLGTFIVAGLAFAGLSFNVLMVIHLVMLLGVALLSGGLGIASSAAHGADQKLAEERGPMQSMRNRFASLVDRLSLIDSADTASLKSRFDAAKEALRFASSESVQGIAEIDAEADTCIAKLKAHIEALEGMANAETVEGEENPLTGELKQTDSGVTRLEQVLQRREQELKRLRSSS